MRLGSGSARVRMATRSSTRAGAGACALRTARLRPGGCGRFRAQLTEIPTLAEIPLGGGRPFAHPSLQPAVLVGGGQGRTPSPRSRATKKD